MIRRPRAYSDSPSPPPSPPLRSISAITSLTQSSLAQVPSGSHAWPFGTVDSYEGRVTSSSTSVSDGEYGEAGVEGILSLTEEQIQDWVGKGKGKGKEREEVRDTIELSEGSGLANSLPPEILGHVSPVTDQSQTR